MAGSRILRASDTPVAPLRLRPVQPQTPPTSSRKEMAPAEQALESACERELRLKLQEIEASLPAIREEAFNRGLKEGEKRAETAIAQFETMNGNLAAAIAEAAKLQTEIRRSAERDVLELSLAIARRVLHRELHVDPHALEGIIAAGLRRVGHQNLLVRTSPNHTAALRESLHRLLPGNSIEVQGDPALANGSVVFVLDRGILDGSIETQLEEIKRGLADCLAARRT